MPKSDITKSCPHCHKDVIVSFKRRDRPGFCSLTCAYAYRTIQPVTKTCKFCGVQFEAKGPRMYCSNNCKFEGYKGFKHSEKTKEQMRDQWDKQRRESVSIPLIEKVCPVCGESFPVKTYGKGSEKKICSIRCYWEKLRIDNHMKSESMRNHMSEVAKARDDKINRKIGDGVSKAWADGKFDNAKVGKCDWYAYQDRRGVKHKVQGTWELAFVHWMSENDMVFTSHRGKFKYYDETGLIIKHWYPDFYVDSWGSYVDVKAAFFYNFKKFRSIRQTNPEIKVIVLFKKTLDLLGVPIYGSGSVHLPYLKEIIQRCRIQPGTSE